MQIIGCHLSSSKGFLAMGREASRIGANTFQFFGRNPRGSRAKPLNFEDMAAFRAFAREHGITNIMAHAPYTINPAATDEGQRDFARRIMTDDLERLAHLPGNFYVFHPGRHPLPGSPEALLLVARTLDDVLDAQGGTTVLLETMSGQGSEVGSTFEQLSFIINAVRRKDRLGVCLDTCHVFAAGYDIAGDTDGVLRRFDDTIGLDRLRAVHCNDAKFPLNSRKDRHAAVGEGHIGRQGFARIINHPSLRDLPFYLETPNDADGYAREIALLRGLRTEE